MKVGWRFLPGVELGELASHMAGIMTTCEGRVEVLPGVELGELAGHMAGTMTTCQGRGEVSAKRGAGGAG